MADELPKQLGSVYTVDLLIQKILTSEKTYDLSKIITAYEFAVKYHGNQIRRSGEPYIVHPIAVAFILLELGMDTDTICASLLHDVVEDTEATAEDIKRKFGQDVAQLVDGVTKLGKTQIFSQEEQQAETFRKVLLAMSQDIRVMIIKLCDRVHNMRTLKYLPEYKQRRIALETMNIYAPIAHRLGIRTVKEELEDLAFHYLDPFAYAEVEHMMEIKKSEREAFIESIKQRVAERLNTVDTFKTVPQVEGRVKSNYGIYKKVFIHHKNIEEIYDRYAVRIIVTTKAECYDVFGIIHDMFTPIPNRMKDYISTPKQNGYQSLHTTVLGREGIPFEVQIRTWDMHYTAEYGIAAHWKYKENVQGRDKLDQRLAWVRQVIESQQDSDDVEEIVRLIKTDLNPEDIVVMTPKGDSVTLPVDATILDFAYKIHTEIGHRTTGAKVDGRMVSLDYKLQTGQIVEIQTCKDPDRGPNRAWLDIATTNEAKAKIRSWFKRERREENILEGKEELEVEFKRNHIDLKGDEIEEFLSDDFKRHNCSTLDDFYASIGYGGIPMSKIMPRIKDRYLKLYTKPAEIAIENENSNAVKIMKAQAKSSIILDDIDDVAVKYAQCCNPIPGDDVVGFITRGHGISVHKKDCINYRSAVKHANNLERWLPVEWSNKSPEYIKIGMEVIAIDRVGLVNDITSIFSENHISMLHSSSRILKNGNAIFEATITVSTIDQLKKIFDKLRKIQEVIFVDRAGKVE